MKLKLATALLGLSLLLAPNRLDAQVPGQQYSVFTGQPFTFCMPASLSCITVHEISWTFLQFVGTSRQYDLRVRLTNVINDPLVAFLALHWRQQWTGNSGFASGAGWLALAAGYHDNTSTQTLSPLPGLGEPDSIHSLDRITSYDANVQNSQLCVLENPSFPDCVGSLNHAPDPLSAVPEPATILLLATGLIGIGGMRMMRRKL